MKPGILTLACLLLGTPALCGQIVETPIPGDPVAIDGGLISGKVLASGIRAYLGVPFAEPPVRELRWRDPQPVKPWKGVYHADRKPSMCMQQMRAHDLNHYFGEESASEDCLYLNLWAPAAVQAGEKRPVLVFIEDAKAAALSH
jgi:para-nitrobenzyl esterase